MKLLTETVEDIDTSYTEWEYETERQAYQMLSQMLEDEEYDSELEI